MLAKVIETKQFCIVRIYEIHVYDGLKVDIIIAKKCKKSMIWECGKNLSFKFCGRKGTGIFRFNVGVKIIKCKRVHIPKSLPYKSSFTTKTGD